MHRWQVRAAALLAPLVVAVALAGTLGLEAARGRGSLVVWSCGGNYELLSDYIPAFEAQTGVHVTYTAAPVQYLLERAIDGPERPDVIVGRGGPGWIALERKGLLDGSPSFFAVDPLVIAVSPSARDAIHSVMDLGRPGVRVAASSDAMRPKGKVIGLFMASVDDAEAPGLVERWANNTIEPEHCGRFLLTPLLEGRADAAVAPRSITTHPEARNRLGVVPIPAKLMLGMSTGRASLPQCAGALAASSDLAAARAFVAGLSAPGNGEFLERHGYVPVGSEEGHAFEPALTLSVPRDMAGWQVRLAQLLRKHGATGSAIRRYWTATNLFGPSAHDGRAMCELADLLIAEGREGAARAVLERVVAELQRKQPNEFTGEAPSVGGVIPGVERLPDEEWEQAARQRLTSLAPTAPVAAGWPRVLESDPPKNGKRTFALAECLANTGTPDDGVKDYLKVCTLNYPSAFMDAAEVALDRASSHAPETVANAEAVPMPEWPYCYATHWERGMTFGMRLYGMGRYLEAFKEMAKLCAGEYGLDADLPQARYRAGVAALALGERKAAARQWGICAALHPASPWAGRASEALRGAGLSAPRDLPSKDEPRKESPQIRLAIAEDLFLSGFVTSDDTMLEYLKVLTVARPRDGEGAEILARATCRMGQCLYARGDREGASEYLGEAASSWPESPWGRKAAELCAAANGGA